MQPDRRAPGIGPLSAIALGLASVAAAAPPPAAESPPAPSATAAAAAPSPEGDPAAGRALFLGVRRFSAGGPPCGACHAAGGEREPLAASFGPSLSRSFEGMDPATLDGLLQELPFPTMMPLYTGHALTPAERADLAAFLLRSSGRRAPHGRAIPLQAGLLAAAFLAAVWVAGRRRKRPTRAALSVHRPGGGFR